jgi:O-antigen ligase
LAYFFQVELKINEYGGLGDFNYFYLSLAVIFELLYLRFIKNGLYRNLLILIIFLQLLVILIRECRGGWLALIASFCFYFFWSVKRGKLNKKVITAVFSCLLTGLILLGSIAITNPSLIKHLAREAASVIFFSRMKTSAAGNARFRLVVWHEMLMDISGKPLIGWGFGKRFFPSFIEEKGLLDDETRARAWVEPHNSVLSLTYKTGLIGLMVFLLIIFSYFRKIIGFIKYECLDEKIKAYTTALSLCVVYILVLSFFGVVLEAPYMGSLLWMAMGLTISLVGIYRDGERQEDYVGEI